MNYKLGKYRTIKLNMRVVRNLMRDVSQIDVAEKMGTYQSAVSAIFKRERVKQETLTKLAAALGVEEQSLVHPDSIIVDKD